MKTLDLHLVALDVEIDSLYLRIELALHDPFLSIKLADPLLYSVELCRPSLCFLCKHLQLLNPPPL